MYAIELKNVWKEFEMNKENPMTLKEKFVNLSKKSESVKIQVLKNINLKVRYGECLGILGKNGSGKTTLLKVIAGILQPEKGEVIVRGKLAPILSLGFGFQRELTARENVFLYASVLGLTKKQIEEKYDEIVKFSELENMMNVKLKNFSDGMVMRLAFSIAFHVDGDILLIDEALSVGDAAFQNKCLEKIKELKKEGKTILIVSHSTSDIKKFCDKALILDEGKIIAYGDSNEICRKYESMVASEGMKRWNEKVEDETKVRFKTSTKLPFLMKKGYPCKLEIQSDKLKNNLEIIFEGPTHCKLFKKILKEEKEVLIEIKELPLDEGQYDLWIISNSQFLTSKPFKILVESGKETHLTKIYTLPSFTPFFNLTLVVGEKENLINFFKNGGTIFIFYDLDKIKEEDDVTIFQKGKIIEKGKFSELKTKIKKLLAKELAQKHFYDILIKTKLGRKILEVES